MTKQLLDALLSKGWSYALIARQSGVNEAKLRAGTLCVREQRKLAEMAWHWAKIDVDDLADSE